MVTRRTVLKQGACATLSTAASSLLTHRVSAQSATPAAFDFYISPTGADSNPGTMERPWAITAINTRQRDYAGKKVGLLDGTYNVHSLCQSKEDNGVLVGLAVNGGTASAPTVVAAVNPRQAILTARDPSSGAYPTKQVGLIGQGYQQVPNAGNVILDGLYVTRSFQAGIFFMPQVITTLAPGIVIRNCEVFDIGGIQNNNVAGIKLRSCSGALVQNNQIHSVQPSPGHDAAGILTFYSHKNIYEYNTIYDCNAGIYDKNQRNGDHTHRYNYIEIAGAFPAEAMTDCSGGNAGEVLTVHNNIFVAPSAWNGGGIVMPSTQSMVFYNNTCFCRGAPGALIYYPAAGPKVSPPAMVTLYNNIIYAEGNSSSGLFRFCSGTVALSNYNLLRVQDPRSNIFSMAQIAAPQGATTLYTLTAWQRASGLDSNSLTSPVASGALFTAASKLDPQSYALQPSSVGRNLGRVGGVASGAVTDAGAWGGGPTRIGCNFGASPRAPVLGVG
jgi:hypothetical protein